MNRAAAETPEAFDDIGAAIARNKDGTIDVNETFLNTIDALNRIPDAAQRAAAAQKIFGRGWTEISELIGTGADDVRQKLADVSEQKIIDDAEIAQARELRDGLEDLKDKGEDLTAAIGGMLVPALNDLNWDSRRCPAAGSQGQSTPYWCPGHLADLPESPCGNRGEPPRRWTVKILGKVNDEISRTSAGPTSRVDRCDGELRVRAHRHRDEAWSQPEAAQARATATPPNPDLFYLPTDEGAGERGPRCAAATGAGRRDGQSSAEGLQESAEAAQESADPPRSGARSMPRSRCGTPNAAPRSRARPGRRRTELRRHGRRGSDAGRSGTGDCSPSPTPRTTCVESADKVATRWSVRRRRRRRPGRDLVRDPEAGRLQPSLFDQAAAASGPVRKALVDHIAELNGIPPKKASEIQAPNRRRQTGAGETELDGASAPREATVTADADTAAAAELDQLDNPRTSYLYSFPRLSPIRNRSMVDVGGNRCWRWSGRPGPNWSPCRPAPKCSRRASIGMLQSFQAGGRRRWRPSVGCPTSGSHPVAGSRNVGEAGRNVA